MSQFGRLLGYARRYRREFLTGLACSIATSTIALSSPMVLRYAVDDLTQQVTRGLVVRVECRRQVVIRRELETPLETGIDRTTVESKSAR